uniref:NADH dehydrogenase subunit 6 n=1 Tax=Hydropsyche gautamittra TaxID=3381247 RepID=UPI00223908F9|nr:NADH dehydrogenase subunit 6 [Ceratopsyche gautamittra]UYO79302.1 NADH dehydrogenase subunit 6 [Ceratopsyche gautamittra]
MMKIILLTSFITLTALMYFIKNPLNMGLIILTQTLIICLMMNFHLNYYWLSYILYLIMLGGILILFMYLCSIASNKIIQFNFYILIYSILIFFMMLFFFLQIKWNNLNMMTINNLNFFFSNEMFSMSKMYNNFTFKITIILIIYLFILLLMVTIFTNSTQGPLRIMNL